MRYFFIDPPVDVNSTPLIAGSDARHIRRVLRLKPGDAVGLFDGQGTAYQAVIERFGPEGVRVTILDSRPAETESPVAVTVLQAMLKDRKMDRLVRQLTELGAVGWLPVQCERSVPRPNPQQQLRRLQRWAGISREAAKQSRRGRVLDIQPPADFGQALSQAAHCDLKIIFWENAREPLLMKRGADVTEKRRSIAAMLGPEGGFTDREVAAAREAGFQTASLGPRVLRAETAALAAVSLIQYLAGDMGSKST